MRAHLSWLTVVTVTLLAYKSALARHTSLEQFQHLDCKSFTVDTVTVVIKPRNKDEQAREQTLVITNKANLTRVRVHLGLRKLSGPSGYDSLASSASCFHTRHHTDYLIVGLECINESAHTCSTGMGTPDNEWVNIYDAHGRSVVMSREGFSDADIKRLDRLGLSFKAWQQLPNDVALWLPLEYSQLLTIHPK